MSRHAPGHIPGASTSSPAVSDECQRLYPALALWDGADPIVMERMFGLASSEGRRRGKQDMECELLETGIFDDDIWGLSAIIAGLAIIGIRELH